VTLSSSSLSNAISERLRAAGLPPEYSKRLLKALAERNVSAYTAELLLQGLWSEVIDETLPHPQWIEHWRALGDNGFPIIDTAALKRLLAAGVDPRDLTGVVRSAQVLLIYNIAQLLDSPARRLLGWDLDLPDEATVYLACGTAEDEQERQEAAAPRRLSELHSELMGRDPSGRHGEPRPRELEQWSVLPTDVQTEIKTLIQADRRSQAAALWMRHVGRDQSVDLRACLDAVDVLRRQWFGAVGG
jgi:hypothetical protein